MTTNALRDPKFRGKYVSETLIWPSVSLHMLKKMTGKESGDGARHLYSPYEVRLAKLQKYGIDPTAVNSCSPPLVNCRMAKGGTGKTTIAANLATAFAFMGYRTLVIDSDPQASMTNMMGIDASSEDLIHVGNLMEQSITNRGPADFQSAIRHIFPNGMLDIIPSDITLTNIAGWLINQMQRETVFDRLLSANTDFLSSYDVIVADSAPGTSLLSMNIMVAAKTQLAVCWLDRESLKALPILLSNVEEINSAYPSHASDVEIIANGYNASFKHNKECLELLVAKYPRLLNENVIQQFSGFNAQQPLPGGVAKGSTIEQDHSSAGAKAMMDLAKSLLGRYKIRLAGFDESIPSIRGNGNN